MANNLTHGFDPERSTAAFITPFVAYVAFIALGKMVPLPAEILLPLRFTVVTTLLIVLSRHVIPWRPSYGLLSVVLGVIVFLIWIGPDVLWPGYRTHWLFSNQITGEARSSLPAELRSKAWFITIRVISSVIVVPLIEELFWRGWMLRCLIRPEFSKVPVGTYDAYSFWVTAVLFASEHGAYWEVGLLAGVAFNWWIVRTKSLADCMLAHAVTNGCLSLYVVAADQWQYWL